MAHNYGVRYIPVDQFVKYCSDLNVETDKRELEYYEKTGIMLPVVRLVYPDDYVRSSTLWSLNMENEPSNHDQWPELQRLLDKPRILAEQYADLTDDELVDAFDREMGKNPYLIRPTSETYKSWDSFKVHIPNQGGQQFTKSTVEHYYSYWQAHQLYFIQQYPDLYKNKVLLEHVSEEYKNRFYRPWAPEQEMLREFKGLARIFDALSFWITAYTLEKNRTFALAPEEHNVKHLDIMQFQEYKIRLMADAKLVQARYGITIDELYDFLNQLIDLYNDYRKKEHYKLSEELRNDIIYQAKLIEILYVSEWEEIASELNRRYTFWTKQTFRHLDILTKERDEARELLIHFINEYGGLLSQLTISGPARPFSATDIDELLDYCDREGFSILLTALSGMIASQEDYAEKFRRVTQYTNLKNILTALEFLLKDFAIKGNITIDRPTLNPTIQCVMKIETAWIELFKKKTAKGFTKANTSAEFFTKLNQLLNDPDLVQSEDTYRARIFLIASLARNLTVHVFPDDDWFYGELFGEMLRAGIYSILYSWQIAKREGWM